MRWIGTCWLAALVASSAIAPIAAEQAAPEIVWMRGGHAGGFGGYLYSPDGRHLITAGIDATIKLWRANDGMLLRTVSGSADLAGMAYSPDGAWLATGARDGTIRIWNTATWQIEKTLSGHTAGIACLAYSADGSRLASTASDGTARIWDAITGTLQRVLVQSSTYVFLCSFSPDGELLAVTQDVPHTLVWRVADGTLQHTLGGHDTYTFGVEFSPDGTRLATTGGLSSPSLKLWRTSDWSLERKIVPDNFDISLCHFAGDGTRIVNTGFRGMYAWDVATGIRLWYQQDYGGAFSFRRDGARIVCGRSGFDAIDRMTVNSAVDGTALFTVTAHTSPATAVSFAASGDMLASACSYFESSVKVWRAGDGRLLHRFAYSEVSDGALDVRFSRDESMIGASGGKGYARIWRMSNEALITTLQHGDGNPVHVSGFDFAPNGKHAVTVGNDGAMKFWDLPSGSFAFSVALASPQGNARYSPDGTLVATGESSAVSLYNPNTGALVRRLSGHTARVTWVAFSADGTMLVSGSADRMARIWRVADGAAIGAPMVHGDEVTAVDFLGSLIVTSSSDATVRLWQSDGSAAHVMDQETYLPGLGVRGVAASPDARHYAFTRFDGTVVLAAQARASLAPRSFTTR